jgi:transposase InsO family protein
MTEPHQFRSFSVCLALSLVPSVLGAIAIVRPETIIRWHRAGFRAYWRWRSRNRVGRPKVSAELRTLIGERSRANPLWGAPHIHGELLKLGFEVAQSTVARYMCCHSRSPSQGWRTFLSNHADGIAAVDLFVLPTIAFRILYCLVIIRHGRRIWVSFSVTESPTAEWISRQITEAFPWDHAPRYLIRDWDTLYGPVFLQRLRAMGIRDRPIAFRSSWLNAYVERLIGSIRRECLDHMIVFGEAHLRRILGAYAADHSDLSIENKIPDHSAFSRVRNERFRDSDIFRHIFERVVETCIAAGFVGGEGFAVDASLIVADANKQRSIPGSEWEKTRDTKKARRAVKEYLATLDDAAFGAANNVIPKFVSPSDSAAQWTGAMRGPAFFAYAHNYLIDVKFGIIMDVEASRAIRKAEVGAAKTMIGRTEQRFGLRPERLAADMAYGSAATLNWLVNEKKIAPHIPVIDKSKREDGSLSREDFTFDADRNVYVCPRGSLLRTTGTIHDGDTVLYRARTSDCGPCPLKSHCCPKSPERKIPRSTYEDGRDIARALAGTEAFEQSRRDRKRVEMLFAHLKRILKIGRLRLRGPRGAQDEFTLAAIAQNLRRLAKLIARPPPVVAACVL